MAKKSVKQKQQYVAEFYRLREEGKTVEEAIKILGLCKATLYRYINATTVTTTVTTPATTSNAMSAINMVEHYLSLYCDAVSEMLDSSNLPAEELKAYRSEFQQLYLSAVTNVADLLKFIKKLETYLKFSG